jgi:hypothetical protein
MGAWGVGIRQDDFVCDVEGIFEDQLKNGKTIDEATRFVHERFAGVIDDPLFWLALADMQWKYGALDAMVLRRVIEIVDDGTGMDLWGEPSEKLYKQRKGVLEKFRNKISQPNPKPSRLPKRVIRKPKFTTGDCLSIRLEDGQYGAALVLATDHSNPEHGMDLVGELDYMSNNPPTLDVFSKRRWLKHSHEDSLSIWWFYSMGFRKMKPRITVLGNIPIVDTDPKDSSLYGGWHLLGQQVLLQREWEAEQDA